MIYLYGGRAIYLDVARHVAHADVVSGSSSFRPTSVHVIGRRRLGDGLEVPPERALDDPVQPVQHADPIRIGRNYAGHDAAPVLPDAPRPARHVSVVVDLLGGETEAETIDMRHVGVVEPTAFGHRHHEHRRPARLDHLVEPAPALAQRACRLERRGSRVGGLSGARRHRLLSPEGVAQRGANTERLGAVLGEHHRARPRGALGGRCRLWDVSSDASRLREGRGGRLHRRRAQLLPVAKVLP
eukprot:2446493-Prymnesium_polylepis.3